MSKFTEQVQHLHEQLAPEIPIESFADYLKPKAIGLADKTQFYAPQRFAVQVCGGINAAAGAIQVDVPVHANANWLATMKHRFGGMIGLPLKRESEMDFRTTTGKSLSQVPLSKLNGVGKLNVFVNGNQIRLAKMPEIPIEYSLSKVKNIQTWFQETAAEIPELVAQELLNKNETQINAALRLDGPVQQLIAKHIQNSTGTGWNEFVRVHHMNSPVAITPAESARALQLVSKQLLSGLRDFIKAAAVPIGAYIASMETKKMERELKESNSEDAKHYAPLLGIKASAGSKVNKNSGYELYHKLASDAMSTPLIQRSIVEVLYNRTLPIAECKWYTYDEPTPSAGQTNTPSPNRSQTAPGAQQPGGGGRAGPAGGGPGAGGGGGGGGSAGIRPTLNVNTNLQVAFAGQAAALAPNQRDTLYKLITGLNQSLGVIAPAAVAQQAATNAQTIVNLLYNMPYTASLARIAGLDNDEVDMPTITALAAFYGLELPAGTDVTGAIRLIAWRLAQIQQSSVDRDLYMVTMPHLPQDAQTTSWFDAALGLFSPADPADTTPPRPPPQDPTDILSLSPVGSYKGDLMNEPAAVQKVVDLEPLRIENGKKIAKGVLGWFGMGTLNATLYDNFADVVRKSFKETGKTLADGDATRMKVINEFVKSLHADMAIFFLTHFGFTIQIDVGALPVEQQIEAVLGRCHDLHNLEMVFPAGSPEHHDIPDISGMAVNRPAATALAAGSSARSGAASQAARLALEEKDKLDKAAAAALHLANTTQNAAAQQAARAESARKKVAAAEAAAKAAEEQKKAKEAADLAAAQKPQPALNPTAQPAAATATVMPTGYSAETEDADGDRVAQDLASTMKFARNKGRNSDLATVAKSAKDILYAIDNLAVLDDLRVTDINDKLTIELLLYCFRRSMTGTENAAETEAQENARFQAAIGDLKLEAAQFDPEVPDQLQEYFDKIDPEGDQAPSEAKGKSKPEVAKKPRKLAKAKKGGVAEVGPAAMPKPVNKSAVAVATTLAEFNAGFAEDMSEKDLDKLLPGKENWALLKEIANERGLVIKGLTASNGHDGIIRRLKAKYGNISGRIEQHHPWNAQIHHTLEPMAGAYPAYYNVLHRKQDMGANAAYPGQMQATYNAYHMFSGAAISPAGIVVNPQPIACHQQHDKKSDSEGEDIDAPISGKLAATTRPPLKLYSAAAAPAKQAPVRGKLVPYEPSKQAPVRGKLVPYEPAAAAARKGGDRPPLKLFSERTVAQKVRARLVPYEIGKHEETSEEEFVGADSYGLPLSIDAFDDE